jgi:hypothetical protein
MRQLLFCCTKQGTTPETSTIRKKEDYTMNMTTTQDRKAPTRHLLSALLALMLALAMLPVAALSQQAQAAVGGTFIVANEDDIDILYQVLSEDGATGTVQVGSEDWDWAIADGTTGAIVIPETVTNNGVTYTVTDIGPGAFGGIISFDSVTIPDTVTTIREYAFEACGFRGEGLTSVTIGSSVTSIEDFAFTSSTSLTTLIFKGDAAPTLGSRALELGSSPGTLYYPEGATGYTDGRFDVAGLSANGDWEFVAVPTVTTPQAGAPGSGDLDGDGTTASDALRVARAVISGTGSLTSAQIAAADMDGDTVLTMADVVRILRRAAGLS